MGHRHLYKNLTYLLTAMNIFIFLNRVYSLPVISTMIPTQTLIANCLPSHNKGVNIENPCFSDHASEACVVFISQKRGVWLSDARILMARARVIFKREKTSPTAQYDRTTVAVACLASLGTIRPGPDDKCAACGTSCISECQQRVCELYCTPQAIHTTTITITKTAKKKNKCFDNRLDPACSLEIQTVRNITELEANALISRAIELFENKRFGNDISTGPSWSKNVAVACLAIPMSRPFYSDCKPCGDGCLDGIYQEVCELFCTQFQNRYKPIDFTTVAQKNLFNTTKQIHYIRTNTSHNVLFHSIEKFSISIGWIGVISVFVSFILTLVIRLIINWIFAMIERLYCVFESVIEYKIIKVHLYIIILQIYTVFALFFIFLTIKYQ